MTKTRVYADFHNLDDSNRLRLNCAGTVRDLGSKGIELHEGMALTFYMDDADDYGQADELRAEGVVHYDEAEGEWFASVDWSAVYHESDEARLEAGSQHLGPPAQGGENGPSSRASGPLSPTAK